MNKVKTAVEDLRLGMYVAELDRPWLDTPFLFQGFPIASESQISELKKCCRWVYTDPERHVSEASIRASSAPLTFERGTTEYRDARPLEEELPVAKEIYASFESSVQQTLERFSRKDKLDAQKLSSTVSEITRSIERNPDAMMLLHRMRQKSDSDFNRAVDNSIHMITFGRFLQFPGPRLELLGMAGLLLDIGKVNLPEHIVRKEDKLTPEEYEISKQHVRYSVDLIRQVPHMPKEVSEIVLQHHERLDGSGYPQGLSGNQLSIDGAIAGLVNTYCALISKRTYAEQLSASNALSMLFKLRGGIFHDALVEQLIQCIGIYPVGSAIEFNTGEIGIVVAQNLIRRLQPKVMLILDSMKKPLYPQLMLDLMREPKSSSGMPYHIKRTIPNDTLPIDPNEFFI